MTEQDKPSADERKAIEQEFYRRHSHGWRVVETIVEMIVAERRDADRRIEEARLALRVIAEMPMPEQDNMLSANMRRVAVETLAAQTSPRDDKEQEQ